MELIRKQADTENAEFLTTWQSRVETLKKAAPSLRRCQQNIVIDRQQRGIDYARSEFDFAGIGEYWFDDPAFGPIILGSPSVTAFQNIVIPDPVDAPFIKRMSTLKRRTDVSAERFKTEWFGLHAILVKRIPGVIGYTQNLIINRTRADGTAANYDELSIDGFVELWFSDQAGIDASFATGQAKTLMTHALEFIGEISTFLVEPSEIN
jgi:EthD domain